MLSAGHLINSETQLGVGRETMQLVGNFPGARKGLGVRNRTPVSFNPWCDPCLCHGTEPLQNLRSQVEYLSFQSLSHKAQTTPWLLLQGIREDCLSPEGPYVSLTGQFSPAPHTDTRTLFLHKELMASDAALNKGRLSSRPVGYVMSDNCDKRKTNYNENRKFQSALPT